MKTISIGKQIDSFNEIAFRDVWLSSIAEYKGVVASGWYTPPPHGMAVLTGLPIHPSRTSFESLRNEHNWPSNFDINWNENILYCYCSPTNFEFGIPGDLAITLYFGNDTRIINHFKTTHKAVKEVINVLDNVNNSTELFEASQEIFFLNRLKNCVVSKTDLLPLDLGHTCPKVLQQVQNSLSEQDCKTISRARQFVNPTSTWDFIESLQFTIEPQLVSLDDPTLPQIAYHYLVVCKKESFVVCNDIDTLLGEYNLI